MRRTPAAVDCSATILKMPISPVRLHVRAAAELLAVEAARRGGVGNRDHADVGLGILVAEEGQRAGGERVVDIHDVRARFRDLCRISSFTCCSISASSAGSTAAKCEKSKRR